MPDENTAARRYRLLLLAYPRWHRQLHGPDMLTALVDAAEHDRRTGSPLREAAALVLDGLRCRARVDGAGQRVLAGLLGVIAAATLAAAAGWGAWQGARAPWPTIPDAQTIAGPLLEPGPIETVSRRDSAIGPWLSDADSLLMNVLGSPELRPGGVHFTSVRPHDSGLAAAARARLAADGWRTYTANGELIAERDGLRATMLVTGRDGATDDVIMAIYPMPPRLTYTLAAAGAVAGALLGWLVAAAAFARNRRQSSPARAGAAALALTGVALSVPASLLNLVALWVADADATAAPPWIGYEFALARPGAVVGGVLLVGALALTVRRRPPALTVTSGAPAPL